MGQLAEKATTEAGVALNIEIASDWKEVLLGADFVALSFALCYSLHMPKVKICYARRADAVSQQVDDFISGVLPISQYMDTFGHNHATDIIENMVGNLGKAFYINTRNQDAVTNTGDDVFLELLCDVDMQGPVPRAVGEMPRGRRGLQELVLDTHELTAEAIMKADYGLLRCAMMTDPLTNAIADADAILRALLAAEYAPLPDHWYRGQDEAGTLPAIIYEAARPSFHGHRDCSRHNMESG